MTAHTCLVDFGEGVVLGRHGEVGREFWSSFLSLVVVNVFGFVWFWVFVGFCLQGLEFE